jgi:hypothetical protein
MKIEFTNHAREKFIILSKHNFVIHETDVIQAVIHPLQSRTIQEKSIRSGKSIGWDSLAESCLRSIGGPNSNSHILPCQEMSI